MHDLCQRILNNHNMQLCLVKHDRENSPTKASEDPYSQRGHKEQKILVVSLSNTVINPGTVVIEALKKKERRMGGEGEGE